MRNADGALRSAPDVTEAMAEDGLYPQEHRILAQLAYAGGGTRPAGAGDIDRYLHNPDGSLKPFKQAGRAMRADRFTISNNRLYARHRQQKQEDDARAAAGGQPLSREPGGPAGHS